MGSFGCGVEFKDDAEENEFSSSFGMVLSNFNKVFAFVDELKIAL